MEREDRPMNLWEIIREHTPDPVCGVTRGRYLEWIQALCTQEAVAMLSYDGIVSKLQEIRFEYRPSTPYDDDTYWGAWSPFDHKFYLWAAGMGAGLPHNPTMVLSCRPDFLDQD